MTDLTFFWIAFGTYLAGSLALLAAALRREGGGRLATTGRGLMWIGLGAQTVSIVWRAFLVGTEPLGQFFPRMQTVFQSGPTWQAVVYGLVFGVPVLAGVLALLFRRRRLVWLLALGLALLLELILLDFLNFTRLPIEKVYEYLNIAAWCAAIAMLAVSAAVKLPLMDGVLALTASLLTVYAAIQPKNIQLQLVPALQSYWLFIHVSLTSIGYAIFAVAYAIAGLFVVRSYERENVSGKAKGRLALCMALAVVLGSLLVFALVKSGVTLPHDSVAYAPHEIADGEAPASKPIHALRYGAALVGAAGTAAYVLLWLIYPLLRDRADRTGLGAFTFTTSSIALFIACLVVAGGVRRQEKAIDSVRDQRDALREIIEAYAPHDHDSLQEATLKEAVDGWHKQSETARAILKARWLPLTLDKQAELGDDTLLADLKALYGQTGVEWTLPIRYKDIKQIGGAQKEKAERVEAVMERLTFPASHGKLQETLATLQAEKDGLEATALLPRGAEGMLATFVGFAFAVGLPLWWLLSWLLPKLRDRLPEAKRLDELSYGAIAVAYPIFTFGAIFAGAIWAHFAWGVWWGWDPKEVGSLIAWVLYSLYLHQRYREGMTPRTAAVAGMLGFLAATLCLAGNSFLGGLHAYS